MLKKLIACIAAVALCACLLPGCSQQESSTVAATVNGIEITEAEVEDYISQYRGRNGVLDDQDFADLLHDNSMTTADFRLYALSQLAVGKIILAKAEELGVSPTDDEVAERMEQLKQSLTNGDEDSFYETLELYGMSYEYLENEVRVNFARTAMYEAEVAVPEPTDDEVLSYIKSNMAGQTLKHSYRITFTGDDAQSTADECLERIEEAGDTLNADVFSGFAMSYSSEDGVTDSGGAYGWSDATDMSEEYYDALMDLDAGEYCEPMTVDDTLMIIYCDYEYTFPKKKKMKSFELASMSSDLQQYMRDNAAYELWQEDCSEYLNTMMDEADFQQNDMPEDAPYNVDSLMSDDEGDSSDDSESTDNAESAESTESAESADDTGSSDESGDGK